MPCGASPTAVCRALGELAAVAPPGRVATPRSRSWPPYLRPGARGAAYWPAPALATPSKQAAATFARELRNEEELNAGDPATEQRTLTYASRGLVGLALSSEMQGTSIHCSVRWTTFDACTGYKLLAIDELDPGRIAAFLAQANRRLHQELQAYITERGPQGLNSLLSEADVAGLRRQEFTLDPEHLLLDKGEVLFQLPYALRLH